MNDDLEVIIINAPTIPVINLELPEVIKLIEISPTVPGPKGDQGDIGPKGDKGDQGDIGPIGPKGDLGPIGPKGDQGDQGDIGPIGPKGDLGPIGPKGDQGDIGPIGPKGDQGDIGPKGDKGDQGDIGPIGPKGDQGDIGPKGDKGDQGDIGPIGPKGDLGPIGPKGDQGPNVKIQYSADSILWFDTWASNFTYIRFSFDDGLTYGDAMYIIGPQGIRGPQGDATSSIVSTKIYDPDYFTGGISSLARPLFNTFRGNRAIFLPPDQCIMEQSIDGGTTWQALEGVSDLLKYGFFSGTRPNVYIPLKNGIRSCSCMIRITITGMKYNVPAGTDETLKYNYWNSNYVLSTERYCTLGELYLWLTSVQDLIHIKVERATGVQSTNWIFEKEGYGTGWSDGNFIKLTENNFGGGTSQTSNSWNRRFTFRTCTTSKDFDDSKLITGQYQSSRQSISELQLSGLRTWVFPNSMMLTDHLYSWDYLKSASFPNKIKAAGGFTSSDGSDGATTSFRDQAGRLVTVKNGIITSIV